MTSRSDPKRAFLRHTLATLAYRGGKTLRDAPSAFGDYRLDEGTRAPREILAHVNDLLDWLLHLLEGRHVWQDSTAQPWEAEVGRFFATLERVDVYLASEAPLGFEPEHLFQGPIADALTHVGQIALMRRRAGLPVRGENYFKAEIVSGRVGPDQAMPRREFA
jgi:hypothetical protein